ncbi:MAG TPA: CPBP family intramembrane glutamic endopeptidase [Thermoanaerobaculia bacterium]|nr:CPBP family intramembrane glutamic endopeptidase [Thermoanaerobaculia bacterium]
MPSLGIALVTSLVLTLILVLANERWNLLASDRFPSALARWVAYGWFGLLVFIVSALVSQSSAAAGAIDLSAVSFWSLFSLHVLLLLFLAGWWILTGRPPVSRFINLVPGTLKHSVVLGVGVGVAGWMLTIAIALGVGAALNAAGMLPDDLRPSPVIPWMAALPVWKKSLIILSAMTIEEAFFRGWMQKRFGLVVSTILFAISHAGYGQPLLLVGVTVVSAVIGYTFYRTRNLWPCIIAHGVFDAIQLFVVVPIVLQASGVGAPP